MYTFAELEGELKGNSEKLEKYRDKCGSIISAIRKEIIERMEMPSEAVVLGLNIDNDKLVLDKDYACEFEIKFLFNNKNHEIPIGLKIVTANIVHFNKKNYNPANEIDVLIDDIGKYIFRDIEVEKRRVEVHLG